MSSLRKLKNPHPELVVAVSDSEGFAVRGLSPSDVIGLYYRHTGHLSEMFEALVAKYQANGNNVGSDDVASFAFELLQDAPQIMAELIALASGSDATDDENWPIDVDIAKRLTLPVQADSIDKIGRLTFTSEMPLGKFVALVAGVATSAAKALPTVATPAT